MDQPGCYSDKIKKLLKLPVRTKTRPFGISPNCLSAQISDLKAPSTQVAEEGICPGGAYISFNFIYSESEESSGM